MIELIILAVVPFVVRWATSFVQTLRNLVDNPNRKVLVRVFVAVLAVVASLLNSAVFGTEVDVGLIEETVRTIVEAGYVYLASGGLYLLQKERKKIVGE